MKKSKKALAVIMALTLAMGTMTGCGSSSDTAGKDTKTEGDAAGGQTADDSTKDTADTADTADTGDAAAEEDEPCTLSVVTTKGGEDPNTANYNALLKKFQDEHPNITIEDNSAMADNDWKVQIEADFAMDNEPDVIEYFTDASATNILKTNKFVTLEEMQAEMPEIAKNTSQIALEQTASPVDGVNYAVPTVGYWEGLYCNKDLFDKYSLELPTTWDKLMEAVKVFNENGIVPISVALNDVPNYWIEFLMMTASTTEDFVTVPETAPASWVEGIEKIKELYDAQAFSKDVATIDNEMAGKMFRGKQAAMQLDGSWFLNGVEDKDNTVVCAFPKWDGAKCEEGSAISGYSSGFYITKKAWDDPAKRKAALKFVYANTCDEQILTYWNGNGACSVPVPEGGDFTPLQLSGAEYSASITNPLSPTDSRMTPEAFSGLKDKMVAIATGKLSAEDGINAMLEINNRK